MIVASDAAVISPTEWPAATDGVTPSALKLNKPAATISGWALAVSLISSASADVPSVKRSVPISSDQAAHVSRSVESFSHALSIPGVCEPCPGAMIASMAISLSQRVGTNEYYAEIASVD